MLHLILSVFRQIIPHFFLLNIFSKENENSEVRSLFGTTSGTPTVTRTKSNNWLLVGGGVFCVAGNWAHKLVGELQTVHTLKSGGHLNVNHVSTIFLPWLYLSIYTGSFLYKIRAIGCDIVFYSKKELLKSMFGLRI